MGEGPEGEGRGGEIHVCGNALGVVMLHSNHLFA